MKPNREVRNLVFTLLMLLSTGLVAQLGVPFADSNAVWTINYRWMPPSPFGYNAYAENTIIGDTMINDLLYKKIDHTGYDVFCTDIVTYGSTYMGALREDTALKKVFFIPEGEQNDTLLYDYTLGVGDTLPPGYNVIILGNELFVSSIDSVETNGVWRQRWNLEAQYMGQFASIIEGVGSTCGLLEDIFMFEADAFLRCYYQDDTIVYNNVGNCVMVTDTCYYVGVPEIIETSVNYYPNPVSDKLVIQFSDNSRANRSLDIYAVSGICIMSVKVMESQQEIDLEKLDAGIYFMILREGNSVINRHRIVKL